MEKYIKVPRVGFEPTRPKRTQDFESCASTNSATWAKINLYNK
jgi:hypothetical protein